MAERRYAQALLWVDIETSGLPTGNDFSDVFVLEVAAVITDFDLDKISGIHEPIVMTPPAAEAVRGNPIVLEMHKKSGLLKACVQEATKTLSVVEQDIISMLQERTAYSPGEFMIAGSGVAAFDFPLIKQQMPQLASWLAYYPFDIGVMRRTSKILAGKDIVNPTLHSYGESKVHRAWEDVLAHIEEAQNYRQWFREVTK